MGMGLFHVEKLSESARFAKPKLLQINAKVMAEQEMGWA